MSDEDTQTEKECIFARFFGQGMDWARSVGRQKHSEADTHNFALQQTIRRVHGGLMMSALHGLRTCLFIREATCRRRFHLQHG